MGSLTCTVYDDRYRKREKPNLLRAESKLRIFYDIKNCMYVQGQIVGQVRFVIYSHGQ